MFSSHSTMIIHGQKKKTGGGIVNNLINNLPFEAHIPGFQYCGPGTKLSQRLKRGDPGINPLDSACREHDISYSKEKSLGETRKKADRILEEKAEERLQSKDAKIGEKAAAFLVANTMKLKRKLGMGICQKQKKQKRNTKKRKTKRRKTKKETKIRFSKIISAAKRFMVKSSTPKTIIKSALAGAKAAVKAAGGKSKVIIPRTLPVAAKIGGALPFLIPLFAGLSATGALAGGTASIIKAVNHAKSAKSELEESKRHNKTMEAIALGKGLYMKPFKKGYGVFLKPYSGQGMKKKNFF